MSTTITLTANASAFVDRYNRDTNQHDINTISVDRFGYNAMLLVFPGASSSYQYRGYTAKTKIYGTSSTSIGSVLMAAEYVSFDPDTVTYNTMPEALPSGKKSASAGAGVNAWYEIDNIPATPSLSESYLCIRGAGAYSTTVHGTASSYKPVIEIVFDDTNASRSITGISPSDPGTIGACIVSAGKDQVFSWTSAQSAQTITPITQGSAILRYKKPSDANWTEINISGSTESYTIPANTLPVGKLLWQVQYTDSLGNVSTSNTATIYCAHRLTYSSAAIITKTIGDYNETYNPNNAVLIMPTSTKVVARFPDIPSGLLYKRMLKANISAGVRNTNSQTGVNASRSNIIGLLEDVNTAAVTWDTLPGLSYTLLGGGIEGLTGLETDGSYNYPETILTNSYLFTGVPQPPTWPLRATVGSKAMLSSHCVMIDANGGSYYIHGDIVMDIAVDDTITVTSQVEQQNSPVSGWVNPSEDQTFGWMLTYDGDYACPGDFVQASASLFWKEADDAGWTEVQDTLNAQQITIPANTFPGGTISWYIEATDTNGTTTQTPVYTISTEDTIPTATPYEPSGIPVTGNKPVLFRWIVSNDSGSLPTQSDIQVSEDGGTTWTLLTSVVGSDTTYTAPANSFTAENVLWRVRAYNRDGVAGNWSDPASFINIAAPAPPSVTVTAVPFAVLNWQASGQQAFRITVDGRTYGPYFGTEKTFTLPDYLLDGEHTASVEVQNKYELWSDPGTATFSVANVPGDAVTLTGEFGLDAELSWTTASATSDFYIYRDDVRIGHTENLSFTDRLFLGSGNWYVINKLPNGNYTKSNSVIGTTDTEQSAIAALDGGSWIMLRLTDESQTVQTFSYSRTNALKHIHGSAWPMLELSPFESLSGSYSTAFPDYESAAAFEALRGQPVILKSRGGIVLVSAMTTLKKTVGDFYISYSFTLQRIRWEDYVDDTVT